MSALHATRERSATGMELDQEAGSEWQQQQTRGQRRQSTRIQAVATASAAAAAAAARKEAVAAAAATAARPTSSSARSRVAPSAGSETPATAGIATAAQQMQAADVALQTRTQARTKAYAGLMTPMEKMCSDGHVSSTALDLLLAACKATHRHAEAQGFAPAFPPELIKTLTEYDVRRPDHTVRILSSPAAQP